MKPTEFPQQTHILAKDQPQYLPLPVYWNLEGELLSCWKLTLRERIRLLFTGRLWLWQLTFGDPLQPQRPQVENPFNDVRGMRS